MNQESAFVDKEYILPLIERDVEAIELPDRIYALGGAGREIVQKILDQDWFVLEAMRGGGAYGSTDIFVIDSATENEGKDEEWNQKFTERQNEIKRLMQESESASQPRDINVEFYYLTNNIEVAFEADFIGEDVIERVTRGGTGASNWWVSRKHLYDTNTPGQMHNFVQGVIRQRGLGKAFFYKALVEDANFSNLFNVQNDEDEIAVIAGLGGGTGSGIFLDIAKELRKRHGSAEISLFATLPTLLESEDDRANTYAALSELEWLSLNRGESSVPFNNVFLTPLAPTHNRTTTQINPALLELDEALAYALIGAYNVSDIDYPFKGARKYSPFTMVVPQVLRYSIDAVDRAKSEALEILAKKREALEAERKLYEQIEETISGYYDKAPASELSENDRGRILERLKQFQQLVEFDVFSELDYESVTWGQETIERIYDADEYDDIEINPDIGTDEMDFQDFEVNVDTQLMDLSGADKEDAHQTSELDEELHRAILEEDLVQIVQLYNLLRYKQAIKTDRREAIGDDESVFRGFDLQKLLDYLTDPDASDSRRAERYKQLRRGLDEVEERHEELSREIGELDETIQAKEQRHQERIEEEFNQFIKSARTDLEELVELKNLDVDSEISRLKSELGNFVNSLRDVQEPTQMSAQKNAVNEVLTELQEEFQKAGVPFEDEQNRVQRSMDAAIQAREAWLEAEKRESGGFLSRVLGSSDSTEAVEELKQKAFDLRTHEVFDFNMMQYEDFSEKKFPLTLEYSPQDGPLGDINQRQQNLMENVMEVLQGRFHNLGADEALAEEYRGDIEEKLRYSESYEELRENLKETLTEAFSQQLGDLNELRQERREKKQQLERVERSLTRLRDLNDLFEETNTVLKRFRNDQRQVRQDIVKGLNRGADGRQVRSNTGQYITKVIPEDTARLMQKKHLAQTDIYGGDSKYRRNVRQFLGDTVKERFGTQVFNGLSMTGFEISGDRKFREMRLNTAVISEVYTPEQSNPNYLDKGDIPLEEIQKNFALTGTEGYADWNIRNGGPWDVAMVAYIQGGGFLDNLDPVKHSSNGYKTMYEKETQRPHDKVARHALGLEEGWFSVRKNLFPPEDNPEIFIEGDDDKIAQHLLDNHERQTLDDVYAQEQVEEQEQTPAYDESKAKAADLAADDESAGEEGIDQVEGIDQEEPPASTAADSEPDGGVDFTTGDDSTGDDSDGDEDKK